MTDRALTKLDSAPNWEQRVNWEAGGAAGLSDLGRAGSLGEIPDSPPGNFYSIKGNAASVSSSLANFSIAFASSPETHVCCTEQASRTGGVIF